MRSASSPGGPMTIDSRMRGEATIAARRSASAWVDPMATGMKPERRGSGGGRTTPPPPLGLGLGRPDGHGDETRAAGIGGIAPDRLAGSAEGREARPGLVHA